MRKILFLAFVAIAFVGCNELPTEVELYNTRKETRKKVTNHFISHYLLVSSIEVKTNPVGRLYLTAGGREYSTFRDKDDEFYNFVEELSQLYGDTSYCGLVHGASFWPAFAYPIDKITMFCDKDFDAEHPAGTPLDDIAILAGLESYYDYVSSGYKKLHDNPEYMDPMKEVFTLPFNQVNADIKLITYYTGKYASWSALDFASKPDEAGEYTFTIEMTTNGKTLKTTFTHTFE